MKAYKVLGITDERTQCDLCGRDDLERTVAMAPLDADGNPEGVDYFGTDCAARAAGWTQSQVRAAAKNAKNEARKQADAEWSAEYKRLNGWRDSAYAEWLLAEFGTTEDKPGGPIDKAHGLRPIHLQKMFYEKFGRPVRPDWAPEARVAELLNPRPAAPTETEEAAVETPAMISRTECTQLRGQMDVFEAIAETERETNAAALEPTADGALFALRVTDQPADGALFGIGV